MTKRSAEDERAAPDALVALIPVCWNEDQTEILSQVHPDVWAEPLEILSPDTSAVAAFRLGDDLPLIELRIDEAIPELCDLVATAKEPFTPTEAIQLEGHDAIWRLTMAQISEQPIARAHGFARIVATAIEAGASGAFFPMCAQLHSPRLIKHLAVDFRQPPSLVNLYVNAWNDDQWMVTRGLTVFGLPELETPIKSGLNDAYFRLMDVAAGMLVQRDAYPAGANLQMGPHRYTVERGPAGPDDIMVPVCGAFGRLSIMQSD